MIGVMRPITLVKDNTYSDIRIHDNRSNDDDKNAKGSSENVNVADVAILAKCICTCEFTMRFAFGCPFLGAKKLR